MTDKETHSKELGETLSMRLASSQRAHWTAAAARKSAELGRPLTLGAWVRLTCDEAAAATSKPRKGSR